MKGDQKNHGKRNDKIRRPNSTCCDINWEEKRSTLLKTKLLCPCVKRKYKCIYLKYSGLKSNAQFGKSGKG
jgi:hypothetical protein